MLSDSIFDCIDTLWEEVERYNEQPFNYSHDYKKELLNCFANLYYTAFKCFDSRNKKSLEFCRNHAIKEWNERFPEESKTNK